MKLKTILVALVAIVAVGIVSCTKTQNAEETVCCENCTVSVDSLMANAANMVGDTITVEGVCSHLCAHGGRKAFLLGVDSTLILRCEATPEMGGAFSPESVGKTLKVTGVVCEQRIGEEEVAAMEARYAEASKAEKTHEACDTEKKAQGQEGLNTFEDRMADYRAKIAARNEAEGKNYLSFYYLESLSYDMDQPETEAEEAAE